jgi:hypothetical protein
MAFGHGSKARLYVHTLDMSPYTESAGVDYSADVAESKPLNATYVERYTGHVSAALPLTGGGYDPATDKNADATWAQMAEATAGRPYAFLPQGDAVGRIAHCGVIKPTSPRIVAAGDDIVRLPVGYLHTAQHDLCRVLRALAAGGSSPGAGVNNGAPSAAGGAAYLLCTAISGVGAELTVTVEDSADGLDWDALVAMTALTAVGSEVKEVAGAVRQYLRVSWTLDGATPSATWFLAFGRR